MRKNRWLHKSLCFVILFLTMLNFSTSAQLTFNFIGNSVNELSLKNLYQFIVMNNYTSSLPVSISFDLYAQNKIVYKSRVENIDIEVGSTSLDFQSFKLTQEQFIDAEIEKFLSFNQVLPAGNFNWCMRIYDKVHKEELDRLCFPLRVEPATPPLLVYPPNNSELEELQPTFSWIGPSPDGRDYKYEISVAEILGKQSPLDAVKRNFSLFKLSNLNENQIQYPLSSPELVFGKSYAWQIKAYNSTGSVLYTEVWRFNLNRDTSIVNVVFYENFIIPRSFKDGSTINILNEMKVDVSNLTEISGASYQILDMQDKVIVENDLNLINVISGNRFVLNLSKSNTLKNNTNYLLKIQGDKGFQGYILFKYFKKDAK